MLVIIGLVLAYALLMVIPVKKKEHYHFYTDKRGRKYLRWD